VISDRPVRLASMESYAVVIRGGETLCCPLPDTPALSEKFWRGAT
jgi:hypothetical protein